MTVVWLDNSGRPGSAIRRRWRVSVRGHLILSVPLTTVSWSRTPWRLAVLLWRGRQRTRLRFLRAARLRPSRYRELREAERQHRNEIQRAFFFGP